MKITILASLIAALSLSLPETELLGVKVKNGNSKNGKKGKGKTPEPNKSHFLHSCRGESWDGRFFPVCKAINQRVQPS